MISKYDELFACVKEAIDEWDPFRLLIGGAPGDEYNEEVAQIIAGLRNCRIITDIQDLVFNVFKRNFGDDSVGNKEAYSSVARAIFSKCRGKIMTK